jgi:hypothetical protein
MSELRLLREQVKKAEAGHLQVEGSDPTITRGSTPECLSITWSLGLRVAFLNSAASEPSAAVSSDQSTFLMVFLGFDISAEPLDRVGAFSSEAIFSIFTNHRMERPKLVNWHRRGIARDVALQPNHADAAYIIEFAGTEFFTAARSSAVDGPAQAEKVDRSSRLLDFSCRPQPFENWQ